MDNSTDNEHDAQTAQPAIDTTDIEAYFHQFDEIGATRKQELSKRFWAWMPGKASKRPGPFEGERLSRIEVLWLIYLARQRMEELMNTQPESVPWEVFPLPLMGVDLVDADLKGCSLRDAHLEQSWLGRANLEGAELSGALLAGANLRDARLEKAYLEGADLTGAVLADTHLEGADLRGTRLIGADLSGTHLEGADLRDADLKGAVLSAASLDKTTRLNGVLLTDASLDQVLLDNTNLTVVDWDRVRVIGEEIAANRSKGDVVYDTDVVLDWDFNPFDPPSVVKAKRPVVKRRPKRQATRAEEFAVASRAYHLLVNALRGQGLTRTADRYDYRAQEMRRKQLRYQRRWAGYLWLSFIYLSTGYGFRLRRIVAAYGLIVIVFAALYLIFGQEPLTWQTARDALQISFNAVHGRVIIVQFHLGTGPSWLETLESIIGIGIEAIFVAALIQKLFSR